MHFDMKSYLKSNHYYTDKHALNQLGDIEFDESQILLWIILNIYLIKWPKGLFIIWLVLAWLISDKI